MKIIVKNKEYDSGKMLRKKYKEFSNTRNELTDKEEYSDEDLDKMVKTIVILYDNQFTEDDINEEFEVSDIIFNFMRADVEIAEKLNKNIDTVKGFMVENKR